MQACHPVQTCMGPLLTWLTSMSAMPIARGLGTMGLLPTTHSWARYTNISTNIWSDESNGIAVTPSVLVASAPKSSVVPKRMQLLVSSMPPVSSSYVRLVRGGKPDDAGTAAMKVIFVTPRRAVVVLGVKATDGTTCNGRRAKTWMLETPRQYWQKGQPC